MKKNIPVEKNKDYIIKITGMGHSGEGVGKVEDFTVFVPEALMDEEVKIKIVKVNKNFAFGKLLELLKPSQERTMPQCGIYRRCGGCQIQHLSYNGQLQFKKQRVIDAITRIGKLEEVEVLTPLGMENPFRYRNKVQLPIREQNGKVVIGFFAERSHDIIDMEACNIQDETADKAASITRKWMEKYKISAYNEESGKGLVRHIMIRRGFKTNEVMVVLITNNKELPYKEEFIEEIRNKIEGVKSIIQNINPKQTNIIMGYENITLWGEDVITDFIGNFRFNISPLSFFQVNPIQTEVLYGKALEYADLNGDETVFDAYCGAGTISLFLAQRAKKVYGIEIIPEAIEDAKNNARVNNVDNVEFMVGESEKVIPELIEKGIIADVVVVDPPRKGCDESLLHAIASISPKKIVYVSCDPGTLARDLGIFDSLGYRTVKVQPVDMFPQTAHVECVALIEKK